MFGIFPSSLKKDDEISTKFLNEEFFENYRFPKSFESTFTLESFSWQIDKIYATTNEVDISRR